VLKHRLHGAILRQQRRIRVRMDAMEQIELKPLPDGRWRAEFEPLHMSVEDDDPWDAAARLKQQILALHNARLN
jgi:hypothetical protein